MRSVALIGCLVLSQILTAQETPKLVDPLPSESTILAEKFEPIPITLDGLSREVVFADGYGPYALVWSSSRGINGVVIDLKQNKVVHSFKEETKLFAPFALSPDGKTLIGAENFGRAKTLTVFDLEQGKVRDTIKLDLNGAERMEFVGKDRFVVLNNFENHVEVWDVKTLKRIKSVRFDSFREGFPTYSPGGKFLAYGKDKTIRIYSLDTADKVQELEYPADLKGFSRLDGLAYSPDGKQLVGLIAQGKTSMLVFWNLTENKPPRTVPVTQFRLANTRPHIVSWSPDGQAILLGHYLVVDAASGKELWKTTPNQPGPFDQPVRLLAANRGVTYDVKDPRSSKLASIGVTKAELAAMIQVAQSGGEATDVLLPKLTTPDLKSLQIVEFPLGQVDWKYQPDELGDAKKLTSRSFSLDVKQTEIESLIFTPPEAAQMLVELRESSLLPPRTQPTKSVGFQLYNLTSGRKLGDHKFKFPVQIGAISPDGKRIALIEFEKATRIDIMTTDKLESVCAFRQNMDGMDAEKAKIIRCSFVGDKLLTLTQGGLLTLWSIPDCKALRTLQTKDLSDWLLSPTGKYLAGRDRNGIRLIELESLEVVGELALAPAQVRTSEFKGYAFDPSGKMLYQLMVVREGNQLRNWTMIQWDLTTGKSLKEIPLTTPPPVGANAMVSIEPVGPNHLLFERTQLFDLKTQEIVWNYFGSNLRYASNRIDRRFWFTIGDGINPAANARIVPVQLPEADAVAHIEKIRAAKTILLQPGMAISTDVTLQGDQAERVKPLVLKGLEKSLEFRQVKVDAKSTLKLKLTGEEKNTGKTVEYRDFGPGFGKGKFGNSVQIMEMHLQAELLLDNRTIWKSENGIQRMQAAGIVSLPPNERDIGKYLRTRMWDSVVTWAGANVPPHLIVETEEGILGLPGSSTFSIDGVETKLPKLTK